MKIKLFFLFVLLLALFSVRNWFLPYLLAGGDFLFFYQEMYDNVSLYPYAWDFQRQMGMGGTAVPFLWGYLINAAPLVLLGKTFGLSWPLLERIMFFYPFFILSFFSSWFLAKRTLVPHSFALLAPLIFVFNTYILLVMEGGQVHLGLAYAITPIVLYVLIKRYTIPAGLLLSMQALFDLRAVYMTLFAAILSLLFFQKKAFFTLFVPFGILVSLHAFWILPTIFVGRNPIEQLGDQYVIADAAVKFFSFARFENTLALLHPNWPENIFGKTYFMRPEFLILPILAYSSLLFINKKNALQKKSIVYFCLLGLLGAFLAKGANEPFGGIYLWMFEYIPGFNLFRDSTKWYLLIAVAYSVLIPFSIYSCYQWLTVRIRYLSYVFLIVTVSYFLLLLSPVFWGELQGKSQSGIIPQEYIVLKDFLHNQPEFFRTLWIPSLHNFAYYTPKHPAVTGTGYFNQSNIQELLKKMKEKETKELLQESSIKYVIIPLDTEKEITPKILHEIQKISWLQEISFSRSVSLFKVVDYKERFWSTNKTMIIRYQQVNPTKFIIFIQKAKKGDTVVFNDGFDPEWKLKILDTKLEVKSQRYHQRFNSFILPEEGNYRAEVFYKPQKMVDQGVLISVMSLLFIIILLFAKYKA